jgi:hypothetical protein
LKQCLATVISFAETRQNLMGKIRGVRMVGDHSYVFSS